MFEFVHPWFLAAVPLVVALWAYLHFVRKNPAIVVPSVRVFATARGRRRRHIALAEWLILAAFLLVIVALARPRHADAATRIHRQGVDIIVAIDLSGSMQAIDLPELPESQLQKMMQDGKIVDRLAAAKAAVRDFVEKRPDDRIGLIGFADQAYVFAPPTLDHAWLLGRLASLQSGEIGDATSIAAPIASATLRLQKSPSPRKVLILVTDGANTATALMSPQETAQSAAENNVVVYPVGIGSERAVALDRFFQRYVPVQGSFDEALLKTIAETTKGKYFHASDATAMPEVLAAIDRLEKRELSAPVYRTYREYAPTLAWIALALIGISIAWSEIFRLRLP